MIPKCLFIFTAFILLVLEACTDSDQYLFEPDNQKSIEISAFMTRSFEQDSPKVKQDTIAPGDSIIFTTSITPSKSIRLQRYFWRLDGNLFANEFSFKNTVFESGIHNVEFVLIDYLGDTLTDTLTLYVAKPPSLDSLSIIPTQNTQGIPPKENLNFVWNLDNQDSIWPTSYHFILYQGNLQTKIVDTTLTKPQFSYSAGFEPLEQYTWQVEAFNEMGQKSVPNIVAEFYTAGYGNQGGVSGSIKGIASMPGCDFRFTLLDSAGQVTGSFQKNVCENKGNFLLKPLPIGNFTLVTALDSFPDFEPDSVQLQIKKSGIYVQDSIQLFDKITPSIVHESLKDTLEPGDTLKFILSDKGGPLSVYRTSVQLESALISNIELINDTLIVPTPSLRNSWTYKLLTISTLDYSGNKASKDFYIAPALDFQEVQDD